MEMKCYRREVNYYETDQMGIVHHSNYIRFFEEARLDWMNQMGLSYFQIEQMGLMIPVMFVDCKYLIPVHFGEQMEIQVRMTKYDGIKMEFSYEIRNSETGVLCTTGNSGHCFLDREMKPVRMKRQFPELNQQMKEAVQKND